MNTHPDVVLASRMSGGDSTALGVVMERYWSSLVRYANSLLGDRDAAEDVAQQTFVKLWERRDAWHVEGSILPLLFRITRNSSLDRLRRRAGREKAHCGAPAPTPVPTPVQLLDQKELRAAVNTAVDSLPERRREVLILTRMHGLSRIEVAEIMDLAPQTVANHLRLAMNEVRAELAPYVSPASESLGTCQPSGTIVSAAAQL